jgi:hypothetical protein
MLLSGGRFACAGPPQSCTPSRGAWLSVDLPGYLSRHVAGRLSIMGTKRPPGTAAPIPTVREGNDDALAVLLPTTHAVDEWRPAWPPAAAHVGMSWAVTPGELPAGESSGPFQYSPTQLPRPCPLSACPALPLGPRHRTALRPDPGPRQPGHAHVLRRQDPAQRRYLAAVKQLALVRKLLRPALSPLQLAMGTVPESPAGRRARQTAPDEGVPVLN